VNVPVSKPFNSPEGIRLIDTPVGLVGGVPVGHLSTPLRELDSLIRQRLPGRGPTGRLSTPLRELDSLIRRSGYPLSSLASLPSFRGAAFVALNCPARRSNNSFEYLMLLIRERPRFLLQQRSSIDLLTMYQSQLVKLYHTCEDCIVGLLLTDYTILFSIEFFQNGLWSNTTTSPVTGDE
jgi:hypothetical protein